MACYSRYIAYMVAKLPIIGLLLCYSPQLAAIHAMLLLPLLLFDAIAPNGRYSAILMLYC